MRHNENSNVEDYVFSAGGDSRPYLELDFVNRVLADQEDLLLEINFPGLLGPNGETSFMYLALFMMRRIILQACFF